LATIASFHTICISSTNNLPISALFIWTGDLKWTNDPPITFRPVGKIAKSDY
jgi:hypothetical protein